MGYEATGTLEMEGRQHKGMVRLEHKDLTFRGDIRLIIPLSQIDAARADQGRLLLEFGGRLVAFAIGPDAAKWAARIANPPSRLNKLGVKGGMRAAAIAVPDETLTQELESAGAAIVRGRGRELDLIFLGVHKTADLAKLGVLSSRLKPNGALWVIRAKGKGATVSESESMAAGKRAGLVDVKVVSFSETHTAEKYVIPVGKRAGSARSASPGSRKRQSTSSRGRS
jgi:hypothetical protein